MTEPIEQPSRLRNWWNRRPRILKTIVYPGRPAYVPMEVWRKAPLPEYTEWIIAWGGKWRWRIRRDPMVAS